MPRGTLRRCRGGAASGREHQGASIIAQVIEVARRSLVARGTARLIGGGGGYDGAGGADAGLGGAQGSVAAGVDDAVVVGRGADWKRMLGIVKDGVAELHTVDNGGVCRCCAGCMKILLSVVSRDCRFLC